MGWTFHASTPIYLQIAEHLKSQIISGSYQPGQRMPSVRELAEAASVNPNTVQRALSELEQQGYVHAISTAGRFVTDNLHLLQEQQTKLAEEHVHQFVNQMHQYGYTNDDILQALSTYLKGDSDD